MDNATESPWLTRKEAADRARVDPRTIDRWAREGKLTRYKVGDIQSVRFRQEDVDALMVPEPAQKEVG